MNKKLFSYSLTVSIDKQKGFWLIDKLGSDYLELFTKGSFINVCTVPEYEDMIVIDINLKDVSFEEVTDFEDKLIEFNYLGEQWKILKECK